MLSNKLTQWYLINKRDLPWRETNDPYCIWISEIILQQTRVAQGYDYYLRFIKAFPDVVTLANASEHDVLVLWQGLGYYSRARNLHAAAQDIVANYGGVFPNKYADILKLKGIGEYTAAAIASFAFDRPYAVVDGNVYRVLSRLFGISTPIDTTLGKKEFSELANELLDKKNPALYNQSIMEFGALQCSPDNPKCEICPFIETCIAYNEDRTKELPVKQGKTKVKDRFFYYLDIRLKNKDFLFLKKRIQKDIWQNLYELPLIETDKPISIEGLTASPEFKNLFQDLKQIEINPLAITYKHILSHQKIYATFYKITIDEAIYLDKTYIRVNQSEITNYPISRLVDRYLQEAVKPDLFSENK